MISTQALARACAGHPKRTIGIWIGLVVVALVVVASLLRPRTVRPQTTPTRRRRRA